MPPFGPIKRKDLIRGLLQCGFTGPFSGGKHQFMMKDAISIRIPNPHTADIGVNLLARILKQAGISRQKWESI
ncbi:MAG: type II toxin-antitoxin system HicA family toxin [Candidatus Sumerlaeota bacterium]|nr:type II toxin-antitoxin system HicA family toxin [Candidatus Sumerlaeota bacterium]